MFLRLTQLREQYEMFVGYQLAVIMLKAKKWIMVNGTWNRIIAVSLLSQRQTAHLIRNTWGLRYNKCESYFDLDLRTSWKEIRLIAH